MTFIIQISIIFFFIVKEAAQALLASASAGSSVPGLLNKAQEYITHAENLKTTCKW